jgi:hypothetical protein
MVDSLRLGAKTALFLLLETRTPAGALSADSFADMSSADGTDTTEAGSAGTGGLAKFCGRIEALGANRFFRVDIFHCIVKRRREVPCKNKDTGTYMKCNVPWKELLHV